MARFPRHLCRWASGLFSPFRSVRARRSLSRNPWRTFEPLEPRVLLAGDIVLVRYFDTWNGGIIKSTDPASIVYHPPSGHLFIADSEINETQWFAGKNVFEVSLTGDRVFAEYATGNSEPTGITYNEFNDCFYITNDSTRTVARYNSSLSTPLASVSTRTVDPVLRDPEGITSDPAGNVYVLNGGGGAGQWVAVFDSNLQLKYKFEVSSQVVRDPEGIAYSRVNQRLYLVSTPDKAICEYTLDGTFVEKYDISKFTPAPRSPQGLSFGPTSDPGDDPGALSLYIADGGVDNGADGRIYEARIALAPIAVPTIAGFSPSSGPAGTQVTLVGTNFTGTTAVRFNGAASSFTVDSSMQLRASVPASATTGPIQVTTATGTATSFGPFTVSTTPGTSPSQATRQFDFGTAASPLAAGYTRVAEKTAYTAAMGYGWQSGTIASRDRGAGSALETDFNFTREGVFAVDLPNEGYQVTVTLGDRGPYGHDMMGLFLEGAQVDTVSTGTGGMVTKTYTATVADGQLAVLLRDLGGADPNVCIAGLSVTPVTPVPPPAPSDPVPAPAAPSNLAAAAASSSQINLSWQDNSTSEQGFKIERKTGEAGSWSQIATVAANVNSFQNTGLAAGTAYAYRVRAYSTAGDSSYSNQASAATTAAAPHFAASYDFGTATSPVESGNTRVSETTNYTARGYGWQSGTIASRDRASGTALDRDLNFTQDGTFAVDLPNGRYQLGMTLGDRGPYGHDQMGVFAEGTQLDTVSTAPNQTARRSFAVDVRDGQLTLRFRDLGGADPNVTIAAIDIALLELFGG